MPGLTAENNAPSAFETPKKKIKYKKILRHGVNGLLVTGMVFFTGFMSFSGALLLNASVYAALAAFFFAGVIEGEVYAHNISRSLFMLFSGEYLKDLLVGKKLAELLKKIETPPYNNSEFLKSYHEELEYAQELEETHNEDNREELEKAKKRLAWMRRHFKEYMLRNDPHAQSSPIYLKLKQKFKKILGLDKLEEEAPQKSPFEHEFEQMIPEEERAEFQKKLYIKKWLGRLSWILNLSAGITCYLVGLNATQIGLSSLATYFGFALTGTALSASVVGLAVLGGLGYTFLIHNTISDMIHNDTLQKWVRKIRKFFLRRSYIETKDNVVTKTRESTAHYALRLCGGTLLVAAIVGLGVFATVATAGTWWYAAKAGAETISWLKNTAGPVSSTGVILMGLTQLAFNTVNSLKSAKELSKLSLRKMYNELQERRKKYRKAENDAQYYNPIRIFILCLSFPFTLFSFVGHLVSMSLMGNQLDGVDPNVATGLNTGNEGLMDYHMLFPETHQHGSAETGEHGHSHCGVHGHSHGGGHEHSHADTDHMHSEDQQQAVQTQKKHKHHTHDHTHADIPGKILKMVISPLYVAAAAWDCYFSKKNVDAEGHPLADKEQLTFLKALKKAYCGLPDKREIKKPQLSAAWLEFERKARIEKVIKKKVKAPEVTSKSKASNQKPFQDEACLKDLKEYLLQTPIVATTETVASTPPTTNLAEPFTATAQPSPKADSPLELKVADTAEPPVEKPDSATSTQASETFTAKKAYTNPNGSINAAALFKQYNLSKQGKAACAKMVHIAASPDYLPRPIATF